MQEVHEDLEGLTNIMCSRHAGDSLASLESAPVCMPCSEAFKTRMSASLHQNVACRLHVQAALHVLALDGWPQALLRLLRILQGMLTS